MPPAGDRRAWVVDVTGLVGRAAPGHSPAVTGAGLTAWVTAHGELRLVDGTGARAVPSRCRLD
jgi:hypothetical protein